MSDQLWPDATRDTYDLAGILLAFLGGDEWVSLNETSHGDLTLTIDGTIFVTEHTAEVVRRYTR